MDKLLLRQEIDGFCQSDRMMSGGMDTGNSGRKFLLITNGFSDKKTPGTPSTALKSLTVSARKVLIAVQAVTSCCNKS
jgi:hypothetical protein